MFACSMERNVFALEISENTDIGPDLTELFNSQYLKECSIWAIVL